MARNDDGILAVAILTLGCFASLASQACAWAVPPAWAPGADLPVCMHSALFMATGEHPNGSSVWHVDQNLTCEQVAATKLMAEYFLSKRSDDPYGPCDLSDPRSTYNSDCGCFEDTCACTRGKMGRGSGSGHRPAQGLHWSEGPDDGGTKWHPNCARWTRFYNDTTYSYDKQCYPGHELQHARLAAALQNQTEFTQQEWDAFGIHDLRMDHFIRVPHDQSVAKLDPTSTDTYSYFVPKYKDERKGYCDWPDQNGAMYQPLISLYQPLIASETACGVQCMPYPELQSSQACIAGLASFLAFYDKHACHSASSTVPDDMRKASYCLYGCLIEMGYDLWERMPGRLTGPTCFGRLISSSTGCQPWEEADTRLARCAPGSSLSPFKPWQSLQNEASVERVLNGYERELAGCAKNGEHTLILQPTPGQSTQKNDLLFCCSFQTNRQRSRHDSSNGPNCKVDKQSNPWRGEE